MSEARSNVGNREFYKLVRYRLRCEGNYRIRELTGSGVRFHRLFLRLCCPEGRDAALIPDLLTHNCEPSHRNTMRPVVMLECFPPSTSCSLGLLVLGRTSFELRVTEAPMCAQREIR